MDKPTSAGPITFLKRRAKVAALNIMTTPSSSSRKTNHLEEEFIAEFYLC